MYTVTLIKRTWCLGMVAAVVLAFAGCGCGGDDPPDTTVEKALEKTIEQGVREEGKQADVQINQADESFSMTVTDENDEKSTMTMNVGEDSSNVSITGPEGKMEMQSGPDAKVPEDFPEDVAVYPGMKIQMVMENPGPVFSVSGTTTDTAEEVSAFYKKTCVEKGWTQAMDMTQQEGTSMMHFQKEKRMLVVLISVDSGGVIINLNTGIE